MCLCVWVPGRSWTGANNPARCPPPPARPPAHLITSSAIKYTCTHAHTKRLHSCSCPSAHRASSSRRQLLTAHVLTGAWTRLLEHNSSNSIECPLPAPGSSLQGPGPDAPPRPRRNPITLTSRHVPSCLVTSIKGVPVFEHQALHVLVEWPAMLSCLVLYLSSVHGSTTYSSPASRACALPSAPAPPLRPS